MNILNRTILASLALCTVAFAQSAAAQEQKFPSTTISLDAAQVKPVGSTVPPVSKPTQVKPSNTPTPDVKTKHCKYPALVC
ncbi:hypothetical protein MCETRH20_01084 [Methylophilaceae bacterium]